MFYLILAIVSSALVSVFMRCSENYTKNNISMLASNYLACFLLAGFYTGFGNLFPGGSAIGRTLCLGALNGVLFLAGLVLLQFNVQKNGVVLSATFMKLGVLVPTVLSVICFGEMPTVLQICGFVAAVAAIILINFEKEQTNVSFKAGLILLLLTGGGGDAMSKVYEELGKPEFSEQFLVYTFLAAGLLCVLLAVYKKQRLSKADFLWGFLIGIPNYFSARFLLKALRSVPAVVAYPTYSVSAIILVSLAGVFVFRETISTRQKIAVGIILAALVLLNV